MFAWVKRYVGIPFRSNGRTPDGCDCYGLVRLVLRDVYGIAVPELSGDYTDALSLRETKGLFARNRPVLLAERQAEPEAGSVAVINERGYPCHLGIYAGGGYLLHTTLKTGSVAQRLTHPDLAARIEGYYRVR
jgi:cell wall-associated NlpC family hydrolase